MKGAKHINDFKGQISKTGIDYAQEGESQRVYKANIRSKSMSLKVKNNIRPDVRSCLVILKYIY